MQNKSEMDATQLELVHAAAQRGVPQALLLLGQMLLDGDQVERSPQRAFFCFERAAQSGDAMAMNMVGRCLDQGWGIAPSQYLAEKWFRRAAELGLDWGMYNLATMLLLGKDGVSICREEAFQWLLKASELGHVKSKNLLGGFYEDGWVVATDIKKARRYYREAAHGGDFRGQFNFARLLLQEGDALGALYWLRKTPESATPAFLKKMRQYLDHESIPQSVRCFAENLAVA